MNVIRRIALVSACAASFVATSATAAHAQTTVLVTHDKATIWAADFHTEAAVVDAGTMLTVVGQRKDWYEVVVPGAANAKGATTGFIYKRLVEPARVGGSEADRPETSLDRPRTIGIVGFGQFGYTRFAAHNTFQAVFGDGNGAFFGGGGEVRLGKLFVNGSAERFKRTGQRVVVAGEQVFGLGIPDTVTLMPIVATAGLRFPHYYATPYFGGGIGRISYKEESGFSDPEENVDARFTRYHVLGGIEFRNGWVATAFEAEYARVPNALGVAGASAAFNESNLGGIVGRVKVLVGR